MMRRREFITLLGGAAAWPGVARAQQPAMPVVGYLHSSSPETNVNYVAAFRKGLSEAGFVEGQNVAIEFRWAGGQASRLPELAADLVRRRVTVITTPANTPAALAAKAATTSIPIVFAIGGDPVVLGLVTSLNRPGSNATGVSFQTVELVTKRLGLLRELAPHATHFVALVNPNTAFTEVVVKDLQASARALGLSVEILDAGTSGEIDAAFVHLTQKPGSALLLSPDAFFTSRRAQIVTLAARHALPTVYNQREFAEIGGLVSYGPSFPDVYQQTGIYVGRVLKGEKPADLPVVQPTKFELVVNLNTAKALGLSVPQTLLALADEVIE
jgi:putative tryptophan/tyrosine transport system substrate-binding protein